MENAGSLTTIVLFPAALSFVWGAIWLVRKTRVGRCLSANYLTTEQINAAWLRTFLVAYMPMTMVTFQMLLRSQIFPEYPANAYRESGLMGDLFSEILKYVALLVFTVGFTALVGTLAY